MPKEKKRGATTGGSTRHAPLGQVIADDENRSKYATVRSRDKQSSSMKKNKYQEGDLLNEKETRRIFELSKEQMLEIELEEQNNREKKNKARMEMNTNAAYSSDEEEDNGSTMGDILDDDDDE